MFDHCIQAITTEQTDVVMDLMERVPSPTCSDDMKITYIERVNQTRLNEYRDSESWGR